MLGGVAAVVPIFCDFDLLVVGSMRALFAFGSCNAAGDDDDGWGDDLTVLLEFSDTIDSGDATTSFCLAFDEDCTVSIVFREGVSSGFMRLVKCEIGVGVEENVPSISGC